MYCKSCGSMIQPSMKTCPRCGAPNVTSGGNGFRLERPDAAPGGGQPPAQSPENGELLRRVSRLEQQLAKPVKKPSPVLPILLCVLTAASLAVSVGALGKANRLSDTVAQLRCDVSALTAEIRQTPEPAAELTPRATPEPKQTSEPTASAANTPEPTATPAPEAETLPAGEAPSSPETSQPPKRQNVSGATVTITKEPSDETAEAGESKVVFAVRYRVPAGTAPEIEIRWETRGEDGAWSALDAAQLAALGLASEERDAENGEYLCCLNAVNVKETAAGVYRCVIVADGERTESAAATLKVTRTAAEGSII